MGKAQQGLAAAELEQSIPSWTPRGVLLGLTGVLMLVNLYLIFLWAPTDAILGEVQRVFYFHVPIAFVSFMAFFVVFLGSVLYLLRGTRRWDILAHSAAEVGVLFTTLTLITGSIWARPIWGVWWTWDPQLTTTLILWLIYVGYLMLRAYAPTPAQGARFSAVLGIVGFVDVPIVYFAANWWRSVHPERVIGPGAEAGSLDPTMQVTFLFSLLVFTIFLAFLLWERYAMRRTEELLQALGSVERKG